jgi:hypothetical protein
MPNKKEQMLARVSYRHTNRHQSWRRQALIGQ